MKKVVLGLVAVLAVPAFAVKVKDCPKELEVELSDFQVVSEEAIEKSQDLYGDDDVEAAKKARARLVRKYARVWGNLKLVTAEKAVCKYVDYDRDMKAKFFTRKGRDILRIAIPQGETHLGFYADVESYSSEGFVTPKGEKAGIVYEVSGGNGEFSTIMQFGKVDSTEIK